MFRHGAAEILAGAESFSDLWFRHLNEATLLPRPNGDRPLQEVIHDYGMRLQTGGSYGGIDEWDVYDESFRRLFNWAVESGCHFENLRAKKEGGREHDLTFDPLKKKEKPRNTPNTRKRSESPEATTLILFEVAW